MLHVARTSDAVPHPIHEEPVVELGVRVRWLIALVGRLLLLYLIRVLQHFLHHILLILIVMRLLLGVLLALLLIGLLACLEDLVLGSNH